MESHLSTQDKVSWITCSYKDNKTSTADEVNCWLHLASLEGLETPFPPLLYLKNLKKKRNKKNLLWSAVFFYRPANCNLNIFQNEMCSHAFPSSLQLSSSPQQALQARRELHPERTAQVGNITQVSSNCHHPHRLHQQMQQMLMALVAMGVKAQQESLRPLQSVLV